MVSLRGETEPCMTLFDPIVNIFWLISRLNINININIIFYFLLIKIVINSLSYLLDSNYMYLSSKACTINIDE